MLNAVIVVSVALFGVSAGAVLGTRARAGRRFQATPALADILVLAALFAGAYAVRLHVWGAWLHFIEWVATAMAAGAMAQWLKPRPQLTHGLTQ
jgi:hypothetical protein